MKADAQRVVAYLTLAAAAAVAACGAAHADGYSPEVLFALEYGARDNQIGVWLPEGPGEAGGGPPAGPTGIALGADGTIYIADRMNDCIKRFDQSGQLLMRSEGETDNIQYLAVDSRGNVYALHGAGMDILSKFGPAGRRLWRIELEGAIPDDVQAKCTGDFHELTVTPDDKVCVQCWSPPTLIVLGADGSFWRTYDGYACTPSGRIASIARAPEERLATEVTVRDLDDNVLASYVANPRVGDPGIFEGVAPGLSGALFDGTDCMYLLAHARAAYPITLAPYLDIRADVIVTRHDPSGRPVAYLRLPSQPFAAGRPLTVDRDGNVYHLSYGAATVDLVRYRLLPEVAEVRTLRGLPTMIRGAARYVPLRVLADSQGMKLRWDAGRRRAVVSDYARRGSRRPTVALAPGDNGVLLHHGFMWVSTGVARDRLAVPLRMDAKDRIAYLEGPAGRRLASLPR